MARRIPPLTYSGSGLNRAECVLAHSSGTLVASDWTGPGGVTVIAPDGKAGRLLAREGQKQLRPNGIALEDGGSILAAHLGETDGGIFRLYTDGMVEPVLTEIDGVPLPPTNFIYRGAHRLWITVSTRHSPRQLAYRADIADGFIVVLDKLGARIAADGLGYTNECVLSADGTRLYVNETFGRRTTQFRVSGGTLSDRQTVAVYGEGVYPDGVTADSQGALWVTSIVSNRVLRVSPGGTVTTILEDADPETVAEAETAYRERRMGAPHLNAPHRGDPALANVSSLAFGGPDLRTAYLGTLAGNRIAAFRLEAVGIAPPHWTADISALTAAAMRNPITD